MEAKKYTPKHYAGSDMESIASVINIGYIILPTFLFIFLLQKLIEQDFNLAIVIGTSLVFTIILRRQFLEGRLKKSVNYAIVFFNILLTIICTMGNGMNDIAIIGYPIIIGFSGIILDQRKLMTAASLSVVGISWLAVGEQFDLYQPDPIFIGDIGDFIVSSLLIIMGGYVAFTLTYHMKGSYKDAELQIKASKKDGEDLERETQEKLEIIEEIHRAVINSLDHIQLLIENKQKSTPEMLSSYESLKRKVLVIEEAHKILLSAQAPIMLDIRDLTLKLLSKYEKNLKTSILHIDAGIETNYVSLDFAINYGICMLELISQVDSENNEMLSAELSKQTNNVTLKLSGFVSMDVKEPSIVIDLLTKQIKGTLIQSSSEITLSFPSTKQ